MGYNQTKTPERKLFDNGKTVAKLIRAVIRTWYHDEQVTKMYSSLVESMPNCVEMLVRSEGGHISYYLYHIWYHWQVFSDKTSMWQIIMLF
jgi:hypothetical protein